ncbi:MAG: hypothetical protein ABI461_13735, partial [Polyangiaceae bacterium]
MTVARKKAMRRKTAPSSIVVALAIGLAFSAFACASTDEVAEPSGENASAVGTAPWGASYVSQSFPLATTTLKMKAG